MMPIVTDEWIWTVNNGSFHLSGNRQKRDRTEITPKLILQIQLLNNLLSFLNLNVVAVIVSLCVWEEPLSISAVNVNESQTVDLWHLCWSSLSLVLHLFLTYEATAAVCCTELQYSFCILCPHSISFIHLYPVAITPGIVSNVVFLLSLI